MRGDFIEDSLRTMRRSPDDDLTRISEAVLVVEHADRLLVQVVREAREASHLPGPGQRITAAPDGPGRSRDGGAAGRRGVATRERQHW